MKEGGVITSDAVRHPFHSIPLDSRNSLLKLAHEFDVLALRWGK